MLHFVRILLIAVLLVQAARIDGRSHWLSNYYMESACLGKHEVLLARHDSCTDFIICIDGQAIGSTCGPNFHFNDRFGHCDLPENVNCKLIRPSTTFEYEPGMSMLPADKKVDHLLVNIPKPQFAEEVISDISVGPICAGQKTGALLSKADSCEHYYVCVMERPYRRTCPTLLHFNPRRASCEAPELALCDVTLTVSSTEHTSNNFGNEYSSILIEKLIPNITAAEEKVPREEKVDVKLQVENIEHKDNAVVDASGESRLITEIITVPMVSKDQTKQEVPFITKKFVVKNTVPKEEVFENTISTKELPTRKLVHNEEAAEENLEQSENNEVQIDIPISNIQLLTKPLQPVNEIADSREAYNQIEEENSLEKTSVKYYPKGATPLKEATELNRVRDQSEEVVSTENLQPIPQQNKDEPNKYEIVYNINEELINAPAGMKQLIVTKPTQKQQEETLYETSEIEGALKQKPNANNGLSVENEPIHRQENVVFEVQKVPMKQPVQKSMEEVVYEYGQEEVDAPVVIKKSVSGQPIQKQEESSLELFENEASRRQENVVFVTEPKKSPMKQPGQKSMEEVVYEYAQEVDAPVVIAKSVSGQPIQKQEESSLELFENEGSRRQENIISVTEAKKLPTKQPVQKSMEEVVYEYAQEVDAPVVIKKSVSGQPIQKQEESSLELFENEGSRRQENVISVTEAKKLPMKQPVQKSKEEVVYEYGQEEVDAPVVVKKSVQQKPINSQEDFLFKHFENGVLQHQENVIVPSEVKKSPIKQPIQKSKVEVDYEPIQYEQVQRQEEIIVPIVKKNIVMKPVQQQQQEVAYEPLKLMKPSILKQEENTIVEYERKEQGELSSPVVIQKSPLKQPVKESVYSNAKPEGVQEQVLVVIKKTPVKEPSPVETQKQPQQLNELPKPTVSVVTKETVADIQLKQPVQVKEIIEKPPPVASKEDSGICTGLFDNTMLPHRFDCGKYFHCMNGLATYHRCDNGYHFNKYQQRCDRPESARCEL